ncbi:aminotransferase class I/II-fold pyridoxal phosphate-dependent enzyme, partial [candidate division GN15 bacterium]|nr:aminotransferase class I/II-fold pyridoxal phosphate-dependent enzyme [candidate division GN15 bacterium]
TLKYNAHQKDYLPAQGLRELRDAVAEFHRRRDGIEATGKNVMVGPGSKELMFLLQLVYYGELLVPSPCWVSYVPQARIIGRTVSILHTTFEDRWRITAESLARHCESEHDTYRPRVLILNYPGNPEGNSYSAQELQQLAEVASQYQIILLSDEIYGQLNYKGEHVSIGRFCPERTIISSGLSKWCGAGGWRLGTFTFPTELEWLMEAMAAVGSETFTSVSAPIQYASVTAFRGGPEIEDYLWHTRRILEKLGVQCAELLNDAGVRVHPPVGGFYLFLDFESHREMLVDRGIVDSSSLCERLLEDTGVAILPGAAFSRPREELTARMAFVDFDGSAALAASQRLSIEEALPDDFPERWCYNVLEATRKIIGWLNEENGS